MNPEIAEQLLYESEATLRLVDSLLDELQQDDPQLHLGFPGMQTLQLDFEAEPEDLSELTEIVSGAAGQARALLEALSRSRRVLERTSLEKLADSIGHDGQALPPPDARGALERALLGLESADSVRSTDAGPASLRDDLEEALRGCRAQEVMEQQLSYAFSILRDAELQIAALIHRLTPRRTSVIPLPTASSLR